MKKFIDFIVDGKFYGSAEYDVIQKMKDNGIDCVCVYDEQDSIAHLG